MRAASPSRPKTGDNLESWFDWLRDEVVAQEERVARGLVQKPRIQPEGASLHAHQHEHEHEHGHGERHEHPQYKHAHSHT